MNSRWFKSFLILSLFLFFNSFFPLNAEVSKGLIYPEYSKKISMDFQEASLKDVLKIFSQQSGLNFIASEAIQDRKVTLYLDSVPVEDALEKILTANNLTYDIQEGSNIFVVRETGKPSIELITKVYYLKYASVSNSRITQEMLRSIVFSSGTTSTSTGGQTQTGGLATGATLGIKDVLLKVVSKNGQVTEDPRTNSLTVTDIPTQFSIIEQTIARLDIPLPQVMIEVEMLDVTKDTAEKLGIKIGQTPLSFAGGTRTSYFPQLDRIAEKAGAAASTYTLGTLSMAGLTAALEFLKTRTDTKYLARPRLLTLSNQTAEIRITTQEAIGTKTSTQAAEGTSTQTAEAERAETGVSLRVTPQVNPETGEITMYIEPRVAQAKTGGTFTTTTGQQVTFKDPEERGTKSIVRIKDGETIMVGGLIRNDFTQVITKVPFLGDIPLLGAVFRHKNVSKNEERELIVFITPHILKEAVVLSQPSVKLDREQDPLSPKKLAVEESLKQAEEKRR
ncbi:MAG: secretin N-terminal domain-containing protein [Candidatus Omnitrophota bacterium]|nr:secretin N-terminal domain-containing protein [Candidatus Omnitrophota bacterium]